VIAATFVLTFHKALEILRELHKKTSSLFTKGSRRKEASAVDLSPCDGTPCSTTPELNYEASILLRDRAALVRLSPSAPQITG
jgi:hypothetical protein